MKSRNPKWTKTMKLLPEAATSKGHIEILTAMCVFQAQEAAEIEKDSFMKGGKGYKIDSSYFNERRQ